MRVREVERSESAKGVAESLLGDRGIQRNEGGFVGRDTISGVREA